MGRGPNVYDTTYVNSGPGVGLSSGSSRSSGYSSPSYSSGSSGVEGGVKYLSKSISNAVSTSPAAQVIRDNLFNPSSSAQSANLFDAYAANYGLGFDMDEYYDRLLGIQHDNNKWSEAQAQKQMDYQTSSDRYAMAWSAAEANKQRQWTERMSDTAHGREVKDLMAAGLNPILAANNGASSGSGATGQGFSSSGAMGQTDMSAGAVLGNILNGMMTTARDLAVTKMSLNQSKYNADLQYASAKLAAGASIYNNNNTVSAQKAINALNRDSDIRKASISAEATKAAAGMSAGAIQSAAATNAAAARYSAEKHAEAAKYGSELSSSASRYGSDRSLEGTQYSTDHDIKKNPVGYIGTTTNDLANAFSDLNNVYTPDLGTWNTLGAE